MHSMDKGLPARLQTGRARRRGHFHFNFLRKHGGKGIRTPGLFIANEALYQLSYTPVSCKNRLIGAVWNYWRGRKFTQEKSAATGAR